MRSAQARSSASNRSASVCDDTAAQLGGFLVRERALWRLEGEVDCDRLPPFADLLAAIDVEHARLPEQRSCGRARGFDERADLDVLSNGDCDVLVNRRVRHHVLVRDRIASGDGELFEVELEGTPHPLEERGMELADDSCLDPCRLARMEQRVLRARPGGICMERAQKRLHHPLDVQESSFGDAGDARCSSGSSSSPRGR